MAEIFKPFGNFNTPGPSKEVIEVLEKLLEKAKTGEITGIACAFIYKSGNPSCLYEPGSAGYLSLIAGTSLLGYTLHKDLDEYNNDN